MDEYSEYDKLGMIAFACRELQATLRSDDRYDVQKRDVNVHLDTLFGLLKEFGVPNPRN